MQIANCIENLSEEHLGLGLFKTSFISTPEILVEGVASAVLHYQVDLNHMPSYSSWGLNDVVEHCDTSVVYFLQYFNFSLDVVQLFLVQLLLFVNLNCNLTIIFPVDCRPYECVCSSSQISKKLYSLE